MYISCISLSYMYNGFFNNIHWQQLVFLTARPDEIRIDNTTVNLGECFAYNVPTRTWAPRICTSAYGVVCDRSKNHKTPENWNTLNEPPHDKTKKMACALSEDSDQPGHPPSLIRVFTVRMKKAWVLSYPLSAQRRLWSDWVDAQADLSALGAQSFC